jgi:hypothetical protein
MGWGSFVIPSLMWNIIDDYCLCGHWCVIGGDGVGWVSRRHGMSQWRGRWVIRWCGMYRWWGMLSHMLMWLGLSHLAFDTWLCNYLVTIVWLRVGSTCVELSDIYRMLLNIIYFLTLINISIFYFYRIFHYFIPSISVIE